jgi:hypothetical protein
MDNSSFTEEPEIESIRLQGSQKTSLKKSKRMGLMKI